MTTLLDVKELTLTLDDKILLQQISFSLKKGEIICLVGQSGSGKTLLTKSLLGLKPKGASLSGQVNYENRDLLTLSEKEWRTYRGEKIGYLVQNPMGMFNANQSILSHFMETLDSHKSCTKEDCKKLAKEYLETFGLKDSEHLLKQRPHALSGGMLQRVMLAMLVALDPDILILDEPTSALDQTNRQVIQETLQDLVSKGKGILLVTHDYDLITSLAARTLVLKDGELIEQGDIFHLQQSMLTYTKELFSENEYQRWVT